MSKSASVICSWDSACSESPPDAIIGSRVGPSLTIGACREFVELIVERWSKRHVVVGEFGEWVCYLPKLDVKPHIVAAGAGPSVSVRDNHPCQPC